MGREGSERQERRVTAQSPAPAGNRVLSRASGAPWHPALTHHQENPEEGHEVARLGSLQLEEVHADDREHDHEEP